MNLYPRAGDQEALSPAFEGFHAAVSFELAFTKGDPAGVVMEFTALVDPNASSADEKFGRYVAQTA